MDLKIESLAKQDVDWLDAHREWLVGHFRDPEAYLTVSGKLSLIDTILKNKWLSETDLEELYALGIALGDALKQQLPELEWVAVEDDNGRDPALRWRNSQVLTFPRSVISRRVTQGKEIDVNQLFDDLQRDIQTALKA